MNYHELETLREKPLFSSLHNPRIASLKNTFTGSLKKKHCFSEKYIHWFFEEEGDESYKACRKLFCRC